MSKAIYKYADAVKNLNKARSWAADMDYKKVRPTVSGVKIRKDKANNIKLRDIPNISLPPVISCKKGCVCAKDCYATRMMVGISGGCISKCWWRNWQSYKKNPARYFETIGYAIYKLQPDMFRWHVSGDVPDQTYLENMKALAYRFPMVKFLAFTKRTDLSFTDLNRNLRIVFSVWPGMEITHNVRYLPKVYLAGDKRVPKNVKSCSGRCDTCGLCWNLKRNESVVFHKH